MTSADLRRVLDAILTSDAPHVEKMTVSAAVVSEILRLRGMESTLVGGGAIEFHAPELYATSDIDLVVEGRPRDEIDSALVEFGFARRGRHWVRGDLFVEVPGNWMSDPVDVVQVGELTLRIVRREIVLADRIIGFKYWNSTAYGAQAVALLSLFGDSLDEQLLRGRLRDESAEDALDGLRRLAASKDVVSDEALQQLHRTLRPGNS
jgi:hypothetical protein